MPNSSFEKAALLPKSYKIQPTLLLFLVVLDQLVILSVWNFSEHLKKERKALVLTFEFCFVNQVQVWTLNFIGLITWFDWKTHHNEMTMWFTKGRYSKPGSLGTFLTLFWTRGLNQKNLKWNCFALICCLSINFTLKNIFYVG